MKITAARVLVVLALLVSSIGGLATIKPDTVVAAGTTSLHIVKYAADGVTVENAHGWQVG